MKLSYNWLKEYLPDLKLSPEELAKVLTLRVAEVEGIEKTGGVPDKVVVGEVLSCIKHPNADKLSVCQVRIATSYKLQATNSVLQIVCGAPNVAAGQKVAVALIGAELPNGMNIEAREVRGEKSQGMICAEDELGLGSDHAGIIVLSPYGGSPAGRPYKIGDPLSKYYHSDYILEIDNKTLTNRPDLWGYRGIARELAAILGLKLQVSSSKLQKKSKIQIPKSKFQIKIEDKNLCPRYSAVKVDNIKIQPSPDWIQKRLAACGLRPINNIVDVTNYIMLDLGEPMHAFDFEKLQAEIVVRRAKNGEMIKTLDGVERKLDETMLIIANQHKPLAIAGIIGGEESGVNDNTTSIVLEAANFDAINIRKTSTKLGLRTESSVRFEKSLDPALTAEALTEVVRLIQESCPEAVVSQQNNIAKEQKNKRMIQLDLDYLNKKIGVEFTAKQVVDILNRLGFSTKITKAKKNKSSKLIIHDSLFMIQVSVPTWRDTGDIKIAEDLVEEVARVYGYDKITAQMPAVEIKPIPFDAEHHYEGVIKKELAALGFDEVYNYSFVSDKTIKDLAMDESRMVVIANPLNKEESRLRTSLIPSMLIAAEKNLRYFDDFRIFEFGRVYAAVSGLNSKKENLPEEKKKICGALVSCLSGRQAQNKDNKPSTAGRDFYRLKGSLEVFFDKLNISSQINFEVLRAASKIWQAGKAASIEANGVNLGHIGEISRELSVKMGIDMPVHMFYLDYAKILEILSKPEAKRTYKGVEKFPSIQLDMSIIVKKDILWQNIKKEIENLKNILIKSIELFDVYIGDKLDADKKSVAFRITYASDERTLKSEEADAAQKNVLKVLEQKFGAVLRK